MKTQTITAFAKRFGLSRATLLYYDRIGLLSPSAHSSAGYRLYSEKDAARMSRIDTLRQAGLPLKAIQSVLDATTGDRLEAALEQQLVNLNRELAQLRAQQCLVAQLLQHHGRQLPVGNVDVTQWVRMLEEAGMDEAARQRWHAAFERDAPDAHQEFLHSLGLSEEQVAEVRQRSREKLASVGA